MKTAALLLLSLCPALMVLAEEIDPMFESNLFKLKLPEGYEQIDDFAP